MELSKQFDEVKKEAARLNVGTQSVLERVIAIRCTDKGLEFVVAHEDNQQRVNLSREASNAIALACYRHLDPDSLVAGTITPLTDCKSQSVFTEHYELTRDEVRLDYKAFDQITVFEADLEADTQYGIDEFAVSRDVNASTSILPSRGGGVLGRAGTTGDPFGGIAIVATYSQGCPTIDVLARVATALDSDALQGVCDLVCQSRQRASSNRKVELRFVGA